MDDARDNLLTVLAYARHYSEGSRLEKEIKDEIKAIEVNEFDTNGIPYGAKFQSSFALLNLGKNLFQLYKERIAYKGLRHFMSILLTLKDIIYDKNPQTFSADDMVGNDRELLPEIFFYLSKCYLEKAKDYHKVQLECRKKEDRDISDTNYYLTKAEDKAEIVKKHYVGSSQWKLVEEHYKEIESFRNSIGNQD
ncbi:hypothetical protein J4414_02315 [Candidatus Woesearchaeota archaeon]|nr:hypothetical protein [Candidatus Woesearchaeota archaeon]